MEIIYTQHYNMEDTRKGAHSVNVLLITSNFDNDGKKMNYHCSKSKKSLQNTDHARRTLGRSWELRDNWRHGTWQRNTA